MGDDSIKNEQIPWYICSNSAAWVLWCRKQSRHPVLRTIRIWDVYGGKTNDFQRKRMQHTRYITSTCMFTVVAAAHTPVLYSRPAALCMWYADREHKKEITRAHHWRQLFHQLVYISSRLLGTSDLQITILLGGYIQLWNKRTISIIHLYANSMHFWSFIAANSCAGWCEDSIFIFFISVVATI